ncbi:Replication factor A C-terminal domain-containing protein [Abeliophyllum distichum]|uniref:Replication factor A C-terminal domain-containing protein n=1 Tax=Abeliophyllum distichum TaxID=126358 RepID=A0ABD1THK8_9LAMI
MLTEGSTFFLAPRNYEHTDYAESFWYMCCNICNKSSHVDFDEMYQCLYYKCEGAKGKPRAKAYIQVQDSTRCIDATMIGKTAEAFLQCTADILMQLTTQSTRKKRRWHPGEYDVVFLIDPVTELDTPMRPETSSDVNLTFRRTSFSRGRKGKQIVKPIKRTLFSLKDSDSSQDEEHGGLNDSTIPSQLAKNRDHSVVGDFSEEDDVPVQQQFETTVLTAWDEFIVNLMHSHLYHSHYFSSYLSNKSESIVIQWIDDSIEILETIRSSKSYLTSTSKSIAHPPAEMIVLIEDKDQLFVWIRAKICVINNHQPFWCMCCNICNKISNVDFGKVYQCIYCEYNCAKGTPRAMVHVQLQDYTGYMNATMIGEAAELFLQCPGEKLMQIQRSDKTPSSVMLQTVNTDCAGINSKADEQIDLTVLSLEDSDTSQQAEKHIGYKIIKDIGFHEATDLFLHPAIVEDSTAHFEH